MGLRYNLSIFRLAFNARVFMCRSQIWLEGGILVLCAIQVLDLDVVVRFTVSLVHYGSLNSGTSMIWTFFMFRVSIY